MRSLKQYKISFSGLSEGTHRYEYELDDSFFEAKENSLIDEAKIDVVVDLTKRSNQMEAKMSAKGWFADQCDKCLEDIKVPVKASDSVVIKFSTEPRPYDDGVLVLSTGAQELEMYDLFYEMICLNLPMVRKCEDSIDREGCEMPGSTNQDESDNDNDEVDPRWNKLKDLIKGR